MAKNSFAEVTFKAFIKPFEAPQRSFKKFKLKK